MRRHQEECVRVGIESSMSNFLGENLQFSIVILERTRKHMNPLHAGEHTNPVHTGHA